LNPLEKPKQQKGFGISRKQTSLPKHTVDAITSSILLKKFGKQSNYSLKGGSVMSPLTKIENHYLDITNNFVQNGAEIFSKGPTKEELIQKANVILN